MEWLLIIGGIVALFAWTGRKNRGKSKQASGRAKREPNFRASVNANYSQTESRYSPRKSSAPARWFQPGEAVKIGAYRIDSGMFYLGGVLPGQWEGQCGNCVVDPTSKVASSADDRSGTSMPYWPSLPDIAAISAPLTGLRDMLSACTEELAPYRKAFIDASAQRLQHNLGLLMTGMTAGAFQSASHRALLPDLWSNLFMVVPSVSTTFASVRTMFSEPA